MSEPSGTAGHSPCCVVCLSYLIFCVVVVQPQGEQLHVDPCPNQAENIIHLSAGGYGNVPIPLIKGDMSVGGSNAWLWALLNRFGASRTSSVEAVAPGSPTPAFKHLLGFAGTLTTHLGGFRSSLNDFFLERAEKVAGFFEYYHGPDWEAHFRSWALILAPRGFGRSSFRSAELVQVSPPWCGRFAVRCFHHPPSLARPLLTLPFFCRWGSPKYLCSTIPSGCPTFIATKAGSRSGVTEAWESSHAGVRAHVV
jgi:hypothetical protein